LIEIAGAGARDPM